MMIASFIVSAAAIPCCLVLLQVILLLVAQPALWITGSAAAGGVVAITVAGVIIFTIIRSGLQQVGVLPGKAWKVYVLLLIMLLMSVWMLVLIKFSPDKTLTRSSLMLGCVACTYITMMIISDWVNRNQQVKFVQGLPTFFMGVQNFNRLGLC